jgi:hypothetical protein
MVEKIVDPVVKEIVKRRLLEFGVDPEKKGSISKDVWAEPLYMKSTKGAKVPIKKVRICDVFNNMIPVSDETGRPYRYVASGNNHHIEIYEYADAKGNIKRDGKVVSMFDAVQRSRQGNWLSAAIMASEAFCLLSAKNEMFMLEGEETAVLHRVQKISSNIQIILDIIFLLRLQEEKK